MFGYRKDSDYEVREHLKPDQLAWLNEHPDYNREKEIEKAKKIADALKAEGWEFASHTWGHLSVTGKTVERLKTDNEKWVANVQNIVCLLYTSDLIIFTGRLCKECSIKILCHKRTGHGRMHQSVFLFRGISAA